MLFRSVPKITEDTCVVGGVPHPCTFVRWMSPYDQVNHVFTQATPVAPLGFKDTGGHLCFKNMTVKASRMIPAAASTSGSVL